MDQDKVKDSFVEKLATQIIRNVQINIKTIHIRYEDRVTFPNHPFSFGCTLYDLTSYSTDSNWTKFIDKGQDPLAMIYKVNCYINLKLILATKYETICSFDFYYIYLNIDFKIDLFKSLL